MRTALWLPVALVLLVVLIVGGIILLPTDTLQISDSNNTNPTQLENPQENLDAPSEETSTNSLSSTDDLNSNQTGTQGTNQDEELGQSGDSITMGTGAESLDGSSSNGSGPLGNEQSERIDPALAQILQGTIQNSNGQPLSGVEVTIPNRDPITTTSSGTFSFEELDAETVPITAQKEGYQTLDQQAQVGVHNLVLVLVQEGALAGRVLDQTNEPVAFAKVEIQALQGIWMRSFTTNQEGRFLVENAPDVRVRMTASMDGYQQRGQETAEVQSPHPSEVVLYLYSPSFSISGRVINQLSEQPVSGFSLMARLETAEEGDLKTTVSQGKGTYRFDNLERGTYIVSSSVNENSQENLVVPIDQDNKNVRIYENSAENVDFYVVDGREISGTVQTSGGQPVNNAKVSVASLGAPQTFSMSDGTYRLSGVPMYSQNRSSSDSTIRIYAEHEEYGTGVSDPLPNNSELFVSGITITIEGAASIQGQVMDTNDAAVSNARIVLTDNVTGKVQETQSGPAGSFTFTDVPTTAEALSPIQGTHTIEAIKENFGTAQRQLVVNAGSQQTVTLTIEAGGRIAGRAVDDQGNAVPGALVTTWLPSGQQTGARTDVNGFYELSSLPAGSYDLIFRLEGNPPLTGNVYAVEPGRSDANAVLAPNEWIITGTLIDQQTGQPLNQYEIQMQVELQSANGRGYSQTRTVNTPDGTYQISVYEQGLYTLTYYAEGYRPQQGQVRAQLINRGRQFVNIQMEPTERFGTIQGILQTPPNKQLVAVRVGGKDIFPTNGNSFRIEQVPEGRNQLYFYVADAGGGVGNEIAGALPVVVNADQIKNIGTITPNQLTFIRQ